MSSQCKKKQVLHLKQKEWSGVGRDYGGRERRDG
jgi:hypothetical protein